MRRVRSVAVSSCLLLLCTSAAAAQETAPLPSAPVVFALPSSVLTAGQARELDGWLAAMRKWQHFEKKWPNESAHDPFGRIVARLPRPNAPAWLDDYCAGMLNSLAGSRAVDACRLQAGQEVDLDAQMIRAETQAARDAAEKLEKNTFFSRVHLDGLWTTTSTDARFYGLVGSHISLVDVGRVQFFGPPGVIVLSVPDGRGAREIKVGYTWGMSVRLMDVRLFAPSKNLTLFLSMTKVWLVGGGTYDRLTPGGFDLAGFSLAPRKKH